MFFFFFLSVMPKFSDMRLQRTHTLSYSLLQPVYSLLPVFNFKERDVCPSSEELSSQRSDPAVQ